MSRLCHSPAKVRNAFEAAGCWMIGDRQFISEGLNRVIEVAPGNCRLYWKQTLKFVFRNSLSLESTRVQLFNLSDEVVVILWHGPLPASVKK